MKQKNYCVQSEGASQSYAIMLAKILLVAIEDFAALGMEDLSLRLRDGVQEIMAKYQLTQEDIRITRQQRSH